MTLSCQADQGSGHTVVRTARGDPRGWAREESQFLVRLGLQKVALTEGRKELRTGDRQGLPPQPAPARSQGKSGVNPGHSYQPLRGAGYELGCVGRKQQKPFSLTQPEAGIMKTVSDSSQNQRPGLLSDPGKDRGWGRLGVREAGTEVIFP